MMCTNQISFRSAERLALYTGHRLLLLLMILHDRVVVVGKSKDDRGMTPLTPPPPPPRNPNTKCNVIETDLVSFSFEKAKHM